MHVNVEIKEVTYESRKQFGFLIVNKLEPLARKMGFEYKKGYSEYNEIGFPSVTLYMEKAYGEETKFIRIELYKWSYYNDLDRLIRYHNEQVLQK